MAKQWFVLHTYSGYEKKVRESLLNRIATEGLQERFGDVLPLARMEAMRASALFRWTRQMVMKAPNVLSRSFPKLTRGMA